MRLSRRARLWWALARSLPEAYHVAKSGGLAAASARDRLRARLHFSRTEAIHRDLGHGYDAHTILIDHEGPVL